MWSMSRCLLQLYSLVRVVSSAKHLTDNTWIFGQNKYQDTGQESKIWNVKSYMQLASFFSYQFLLSCLDDVSEECERRNTGWELYLRSAVTNSWIIPFKDFRTVSISFILDLFYNPNENLYRILFYYQIRFEKWPSLIKMPFCN